MKKQSFAKKSLGQNFLQSTEIREKILEAAGDIKGGNILEIGPGLGFLTGSLLKKKANLTAIDLDDRVIPLLHNDFGHKDHFDLIHGDVLQFDPDEYFEQNKYSIIANIPYNITSPILRKFLSKTKNKPEFMILMVQKEVAKKICNTEKRSILSISVEVFAEAEIITIVRRHHFSPVPKVDSAVIKITIRKKPLINLKKESDFFTVINGAFSRKRKK